MTKGHFSHGKTTLERFEALYVGEPNCGCWLWMGSSLPKGYGMFWDGERHVRANRASWRLFRGEIPGGAHVLHKCDVPACVNPGHLFLGSHQENIDDREAKGRNKLPPPRTEGLSGEANGRAKLTRDQVEQIRADSRPSRELGRIYGVSKTQIQVIRNGRGWSDV